MHYESNSQLICLAGDTADSGILYNTVRQFYVKRCRNACNTFVDDAPAFENADTQDKREEKFVLFKERSADIAVDAVSEVLVENFTSF